MTTNSTQMTAERLHDEPLTVCFARLAGQLHGLISSIERTAAAPTTGQADDPAYQERLTEIHREIDRINRAHGNIEGEPEPTTPPLEVYTSPTFEASTLTHPPLVELGNDNQVRVCGLAGDGDPVLANVEVVQEAAYVVAAGLVVLVTGRCVYVLGADDVVPQLQRDLEIESLAFRREWKRTMPADVGALIATVERQRLQQAEEDDDA